MQRNKSLFFSVFFVLLNVWVLIMRKSLLLRRHATISYLSSIVVLAVSFISCSRVAEQDLLLFHVKEVGDVQQAVTVVPQKASDALYLAGFVVRGDELITAAGFMADYCVDVVNLSSGDVVRRLCRKGRGPGEFLSVSPFFSLEDSSITVFDAAVGAVSEIPLDGDPSSVSPKVRLEAPPGKGTPAIMSTYKLSGPQVLAYNSIQGSAAFVSTDTPYYAIYNLDSGKEEREFRLFDTAPLETVNEEWIRMNTFALVDCIDDAKGTVCFAMNTMPVYGFLDIRSGEVRGFRIKGAPAYSSEELNMCFTGICSQGRYLYALYFGKPSSQHQPGAGTVLYKLDWDGRILGKYGLDGLYRGCYATHDELFLSKVEDSQTVCLYRLKTSDL